jgi:murein DD-endopeptidase MepM/ murein hydrolase activator NlpD
MNYDSSCELDVFNVDSKCTCRHCAPRQGGNFALVAHSVRFLSSLGQKRRAGLEGSAGRLQSRDNHRSVVLRSNKRGIAPVRTTPRSIRLETSFLEEPQNHRWLLTTCIAGIACSVLIGGTLLGVFGENAAPPEAMASVQPGQVQEIPASNTQSVVDVANGNTTVSRAEVIPERELNGDWKYPVITQDELPYASNETAVLDAEIDAANSDKDNITEIAQTPPPEPTDETFKLAGNATLVDALLARGISKNAAEGLVASIDPILPRAMIKPGTEFTLTLDRQIDFYGRVVTFPVELSFKPGPKEKIVVEADEDGQFLASIDGKDDGARSQYAQVDHFRSRARVGSSLYATAKDNRIPDYIVSEFTRVFSYDVDFQRQIAASDSFEMFYGAPLSGSSSKRKVLHYAELNFDGKTKTYYRYTTADGQTDYFDETGKSASRALLKTPISGARLTSGFGMRRHPLLGYSKMHAGVDFGAPAGTPIRAAGAGIIKKAGRNGAYGISVVLKHTNKYESLYAHMSRLASGVREGDRVNQGQIIGYVGSTGRSTGPHLHYEVRVNSRPVNPTAIRAAGGRQLAGAELMKFRTLKQKVATLMQAAPSAVQVAQAGQ